MEDNLDPGKLVWVVSQEEKAIGLIQMFPQQFQDRINDHFDDIALFNQLSGLNNKNITLETKRAAWELQSREKVATYSAISERKTHYVLNTFIDKVKISQNACYS